MNQQTLSTRVSRAEQVLGVTVFERSPYGIKATESGEVVLEAVPALLTACADFAHNVEQARTDNLARHLTVAVSNTVAEIHYPVWAAAFRDAHPKVKLTMVHGNSQDVRELVATGIAELGIVEGGTPRHDLIETVLCPDELVLAVPAHHLWANRESVSREELRATPLIVREPGSGTRRVIEEELGELADPAGEFGSLSAQRAGMIDRPRSTRDHSPERRAGSGCFGGGGDRSHRSRVRAQHLCSRSPRCDGAQRRDSVYPAC